MSIDKKILSEIQRYRSINNYILEQEVPPPPVDAGAPPVPEVGPPPPPDEAGAAPAEPIDVEK